MLSLGSNKIGSMYLGSTKIIQAYLGSTLVYEDADIDHLVFELPTTTFTGTSGQQISSGYRLLQKQPGITEELMTEWTLFYNVIENNCTTSNLYLLEDGTWIGSSSTFSNIIAGCTEDGTKTILSDGHNSIVSATTGKVALRRKFGNKYIQYTTDGINWIDITSLEINKFIYRGGRTLTFGGRADKTGNDGIGTISAVLWNKSLDNVSVYFDDTGTIEGAVYTLPETTFDGSSTQRIITNYELIQSKKSPGSLFDWTLFVNIIENNGTTNSTWLYEDGTWVDSSSKYANIQGGYYTTKMILNDGYTNILTGDSGVGKAAIRRKSGNSYIQYSTDGKTWIDITSLPINRFIQRIAKMLTFGGKADGTGNLGIGTISAKLWNKAYDDISSEFEDTPPLPETVYELSSTTFNESYSEVVQTEYTPLRTDTDFTLFCDVTDNQCSTSDAYNHYLMVFADQNDSDYHSFVVGSVNRSNALLQEFTDGSIYANTLISGPTGKFGIRRKSTETYIQYTTDGKTWINTSCLTSFRGSTSFTELSRFLGFGGIKNSSFFTVYDYLGKGTISAKYWSESIDDISELF